MVYIVNRQGNKVIEGKTWGVSADICEGEQFVGKIHIYRNEEGVFMKMWTTFEDTVREVGYKTATKTFPGFDMVDNVINYVGQEKFGWKVSCDFSRNPHAQEDARNFIKKCVEI